MANAITGQAAAVSFASLDSHEAAREQLIAARREIVARLNRAVRRLRTFKTEEDWSRALVEATQGFSARAALFVVNGSELRLQSSRGVSSDLKIGNTPFQSAPAFAAAVESRDAIVALRTSGEMSPSIAHLLGVASDERFYLFPIMTRNRVAAVLYADSPGGEIDAGAVELIAAFATWVLEAQSPQRSGLVTIAADTMDDAAP